jgi:hypothetical protein
VQAGVERQVGLLVVDAVGGVEVCVATQTSTPPTAFDISTTPLNCTTPPYGMSRPVSPSTMRTVHSNPPRDSDSLSWARGSAGYCVPSGPSHSGMGTSMSRGNETTVARVLSSLMWRSIVTSLRVAVPTSASAP